MTTRQWFAWMLLSSPGLAALAGCVWLNRQPDVAPELHRLERAPLVIQSDFPLARQHRLVDELVALRTDVSARLQLPTTDEPIYVFLFENPSRYQAYVSSVYPQLPGRRALFVETDTRLAVYAQWGDRVAEDLRHEVAHGYLHAVVPDIPLWLDEGLAEFFELPRGQRGRHAAHIGLLYEHYQHQQWLPQLPRLHALQQMADMTQLDYAESWLWVHFLLETSPVRREMLQLYLARVRMTAQAPPLDLALRDADPQFEAAVLDHLQALYTGER